MFFVIPEKRLNRYLQYTCESDTSLDPHRKHVVSLPPFPCFVIHTKIAILGSEKAYEWIKRVCVSILRRGRYLFIVLIYIEIF